MKYLLCGDAEIGAELLAEAAGIQRASLGETLLTVAYHPNVVSYVVDTLSIAAERISRGWSTPSPLRFAFVAKRR